MKNVLVPSWRKAWRKYSTWLALSLPAMSALSEAMPSLQAVIHPEQYKWIVGVLGFVIVIATNIKQKSVSGDQL